MTVPTPITGPCAWRGEEMAGSTRGIRRLDAGAVAEIDAALGAARSADVPWHETTRERFEPGDMQLVNNRVIYHARTAFEDDAGGGRVRLLHRLWLSMPNSRALPPGHEVLWGSVEPGAPRGGINQVPAI
jgi:hypothetical protein